jgi:rhodanese-related sulfurtransferase
MSSATATPTASLTRAVRSARPQMLPTAVEGEPGLFVVDGTWGTITAMEIAPGVRTVGELEVIAHIEAGLPVIDTREPQFHRAGTIPGARGVPHEEVVDRVGVLDPDRPTVFFCNGPQCSATPQAIRALLEAGHPPAGILYYRGGMRDWITLGLPVE